MPKILLSSHIILLSVVDNIFVKAKESGVKGK